MNEPVRGVWRVDAGRIWRVGGGCGPVWPTGFGAKRCGGGRHEFGARVEMDILGQSARDLRHIWSQLAGTSEHFLLRAGSTEKGGEIAKAGHPL